MYLSILIAENEVYFHLKAKIYKPIFNVIEK